MKRWGKGDGAWSVIRGGPGRWGRCLGLDCTVGITGVDCTGGHYGGGAGAKLSDMSPLRWVSCRQGLCGGGGTGVSLCG